MSSSLEATKKKIEELKRIRQQQNQRNRTNQPAEQTTRVQQRQKRAYSYQKSEDIHIAGTLVETYDMQIQCALETRSLDSKAHKQIQNEDKQFDLLQPREHKRKNEGRKEEAQVKQVHEFSGEELDSLVKSKHFTDFFNKSSKFLEKVLDHGDGDMIELLLRDGIKSRNRSGHDILVHSVTLAEPNYTGNRVVTDIDWSDQIKDVFCASYSQNQEGSIKDHVGLVLVWNPLLKNRPEFQCFAQSAVTSTKFFPFANNTILGGCYNGQILLWDIRAKSMPEQRSGISADAHKYPVNSLSVIGTQIANNIASFSNDGMMCIWDIKQLSKPIRVSKLSAPRPVKAQKPTGTTASTILAGRTIKPDQSASSILERTAKEQTHDINITCSQFPSGDANNYYVGSLNGVLYRNALHNKSTEKITLFDEHNGPISSVSINPPSEYEAMTGLVLTSSFDWTVKLWSPNSKESLRTFQNSQDYIYDVAWNPKNPSLFATVNNQGYLDIFDLTRDLQLPIAHQKVNNSNNAQNKCKWHADGSLIVTGDSSGNLNVYVLAEKYRKMDGSKYDDFQRYIYQTKEEV